MQATDANLAELYERDYHAWVLKTVALLKEGRFEALDLVNLMDELESMARRDKKSLRSDLRIVLLHLLKWQYQPQRRSGGWEESIDEHRLRILDDLQDSPSLKPYLLEVFASVYAQARKLAAKQTRLPVETFPKQCPYTVEQVLEEDFMPSGQEK
jgi:hypothetical protein